MIDIRFVPAPWSSIRESVKSHLVRLPSKIDSFLEDHILASNHYVIEIASEAAGFASIHNEQLIVLFNLEERFRRHGQAVFARLRRLEKVQSAFVPTCDEFFLSHALDDYRQLAKQAYFFAVGSEAPPSNARHECTLHLATTADVDFIRGESGDLFGDLDRYVDAGEIFLTLRDDVTVGFGILSRSAIYGDVASIGMFTISRFRQSGVGTATIALLIEECRRRELLAVAGCWYYNHNSKRTLERAGMISLTRLLKIDY